VFSLLGCRPKREALPPKPPRPNIILGTNPWKLTGEPVCLAISPSGTKLAIVEERSIKVIDLTRNLLLSQLVVSIEKPKQAIFVDHERSLLVIAGADKEAYVHPLNGAEPTFLSSVEYAEADFTGERILLRNDIKKTTCLVKRKDLRLIRKRSWDCLDGYATFLPTGELLRSRKNRLELNGEPLDLDYSIDTGAIWPDPTGDRVFIFSKRYAESDPQETSSHFELQEVDLTTKKVSTRTLPEEFSSPELKEVLRGSVLFWLPPVSPWAEQNDAKALLQFYDLSTGSIRSFSEEPVPFQDTVVSPSGEFLYVASGHSVVQYRVANGQILQKAPLGHTNQIQEILFSEDNQYLISRDAESVIVWDLSTREPKFEVKVGTSALGVLGGFLLYSTRDELVAMRLSDGQEAWRRTLRRYAWRFLPKNDKEMTVWLENAPQGEPNAVIVTVANGAIRTLSISPTLKAAAKGYQSDWQTSDGDKVIWIASDQKVAITNTEGVSSSSTQEFEALRLTWLFGGHLAAAITDEDVIFLDGQNAQVMGVTGKQTCGLVCQVEASPTQKQVAIEDKGIIHFWDISQKKLLWELRGARAPAFSPDGKWLAVARLNGEIVLYPTGPK
jgi:WD40 repeat protein